MDKTRIVISLPDDAADKLLADIPAFIKYMKAKGITVLGVKVGADEFWVPCAGMCGRAVVGEPGHTAYCQDCWAQRLP